MRSPFKLKCIFQQTCIVFLHWYHPSLVFSLLVLVALPLSVFPYWHPVNPLHAAFFGWTSCTASPPVISLPVLAPGQPSARCLRLLDFLYLPLSVFPVLVPGEPSARCLCVLDFRPIQHGSCFPVFLPLKSLLTLGTHLYVEPSPITMHNSVGHYLITLSVSLPSVTISSLCRCPFHRLPPPARCVLPSLYKMERKTWRVLTVLHVYSEYHNKLLLYHQY